MGGVNRLSKVILIAIAALAVIVVAALVGINLYVQSPATQVRIQAELSKALRLPLKITSTTVTLWGGLHMSGLSVPPINGSQMEAKSFDADYRLLPLFHGQLAVSKMTLDSPHILWAQDAEGRWRLPGLPDTHEHKVTTSAPKEQKEKSNAVTVDAIEIHGGSIDLVDSEHKRVWSAEDVVITSTFRHADDADGTLTASHLSWEDALKFSEVRSAVHFKDGKLSFTDLHGSLAGGAVDGTITIQPDEKESPYTAALAFEGVDLARLTTEANWQPGQSAGTLGGKFDLHGSTQKMEAAEGSGHLTLANGQFNQLQLFQMIGLLLQIPELSDLRPRNAQADFRIANQHTYIDQLLVETTDLQFSTKGNVRFDGRVSMNARLAVSKKVAGELPTIVTASLTPADEAGRRAIEFEITGRTDKLRTNLKEKIFNRQNVTSQIDELLSSVFGGGDSGGKKKKDKEKKKDDAGKGTPNPEKAPGANANPASPVTSDAPSAPAADPHDAAQLPPTAKEPAAAPH